MNTIDDDVRDFLLRQADRDERKEAAKAAAYDAYAALPPVTHGESVLKSTGFQKIPDEKPPVDDAPDTTTPTIIAAGCLTSAQPYIGAMLPGDHGYSSYTAAFTVSLTSTPIVLYSDGSRGPAPANATVTYLWTEEGVSVPIADPTAANTTGSVPSGKQADGYCYFTCQVTVTIPGVGTFTGDGYDSNGVTPSVSIIGTYPLP